MNKEIYKLIVAGNINIPSMINSIIAATIELRENNTDEKDRFNQIHIFHTEESLKTLMSPDLIEKWQHALNNYNISHTSIIHYVTKIEDDSTTIFRGFVEQLKTIINPFDNANYYVDLTSGLTAIKGILAIFSYVVDIEHIYTLEINFTKYKEQRSLFYAELISENVKIKYKKFPKIKEFDDFGKLNHTEIIRHKEIINNQIEQLSAFLPLNSDLSHLKSSLLSSVNSRLLGDVTKNIDNYRQSVFSSSASVEEMSDFILNNLLDKDMERGTLGQKLEIIRENYGEKKS